MEGAVQGAFQLFVQSAKVNPGAHWVAYFYNSWLDYRFATLSTFAPTRFYQTTGLKCRDMRLVNWRPLLVPSMLTTPNFGVNRTFGFVLLKPALSASCRG